MIGVVAAFRDEIRGYLKRGRFRFEGREEGFRVHKSEANPRIVVIDGGIGKLRAQQATRALVESFDPELIVSAGFAGGLKADQHTGDLFICDRLFAVEGQAPAWRPEVASQLSMVELSAISRTLRVTHGIGRTYSVCGCLSVPQMVEAVGLKRQIEKLFPVGVIDLESFWVGQTAASFGIPYVSIRTVFDTVDQTLPEFVGQAVSGEGNKLWMRAARYVATNPFGTPYLMRLAAQSMAASSALGKFLAELTSIER